MNNESGNPVSNNGNLAGDRSSFIRDFTVALYSEGLLHLCDKEINEENITAIANQVGLKMLNATAIELALSEKDEVLKWVSTMQVKTEEDKKNAEVAMAAVILGASGSEITIENFIAILNAAGAEKEKIEISDIPDHEGYIKLIKKTYENIVNSPSYANLIKVADIFFPSGDYKEGFSPSGNHKDLISSAKQHILKFLHHMPTGNSKGISFSAEDYKKWAETPDDSIKADDFIKLKVAAATALIDYNDWANAEKIIDKALKLKPEDSDLFYLKGMVLQFSQKNVPLAIEFYTKAVEHAGEERDVPMYANAHEFYAARADAYDYIGKYNEAIADFSKCLEYDQKNVRNLLRRAEVYNKIDQKDNAIADIKKALEIEPNNKEAQGQLKKLQG